MSDEIYYQTSWLIAESSSSRSHITQALRTLQNEYSIFGKRIVELGSGIGTNLSVFADTNSVLGVEGLPDAVNESRRRGINTIVGNLENSLPLPDRSCDWVLCIDVLEHLVHPAACLASARRILCDGGYIVVNVPNHFDLRGRLRILWGSGIDSQRYFVGSPHWEYPHIRFFNRQSIGELLVKSGFQIVQDYRSRLLSFPRLHVFEALGLRRVLLAMQARRPDLFSSGYLLLCRKQ